MVISDPRHTECSNLTEAGCKCVSFHKAKVVITDRAHYFHDCIYIFTHTPESNVSLGSPVVKIYPFVSLRWVNKDKNM